MTKRFILSMICGLGILSFIGGCAPTTTQHSTSVSRVALGSADSEASQSLVHEAEIALQRAISADPAERDTLLLDSAILFAQAGDIRHSQQTLDKLNPGALSNDYFVEYSLLGLELDLASYQLDSARKRLEEPRFVSLRQELGQTFQQRILSLASDINYVAGDIRNSVETSIQLSALYNPRKFSDQRSIALLNDKIWVRLSEMPFHQLQQMDAGDTSVLGGWLELAASMRYRQADPVAQKTFFSVWQKRWREHPAAKYPPAALSNRSSGRIPEDIALLLPLQGNYAIASDTLLSGFMSGYYENMSKGQATPTIAIYDTSSRPVTAVYDEAVNRGADLVIGPLRQSQVKELIANSDLKVPTLTLNRLDNDNENNRTNNDSPGDLIDEFGTSTERSVSSMGRSGSLMDRSGNPENLLQFGLSAEDEMDQISRRAWLQGQRNAFLITPESSWGQRAQRHFVDSWTARGGVVIGAITYPDSVNDFTQLLRSPLEIDLSEKRGLALRRSVKYGLNSTPRRRQDIDLVIVLGYGDKVRQIKPSLDFLYAGDIPVYATSHIYGGSEEIELNRDLSGITFSAMPWTLNGQLPRTLQPDQRLPTAFRQLYAMGYDAFLLHGLLDQLNSQESVPIFGATGLLKSSNGIITRDEKWAEFKNGRVIPAQP